MVTMDFSRSVKSSGKTGQKFVSDLFQRPVQWILTANSGVDQMIIISPYEAQHLLPAISKSRYVNLHLYAPRPNLGYKPLDSLDLYTVPEKFSPQIPSDLIIELNLFAGQLYFETFKEYTNVCHFLQMNNNRQEKEAVVWVDGCFPKCPIKFFKVLLTNARRNCENIDKTHMGHLLDSKILSPQDFDFANGG